MHHYLIVGCGYKNINMKDKNYLQLSEKCGAMKQYFRVKYSGERLVHQSTGKRKIVISVSPQNNRSEFKMN